MCPSDNTRFKSGALANLTGNYDTPIERRLIEIKPSTICAGLGVFARKVIWPYQFISEYAAELVDNHNISDYDYALDAEEHGTSYIGISDPSFLNGRGVGQLVNDAISPVLSGKHNNSRLIITPRGPYIQALSTIYPGEEIFAAYGLAYWKSRINRSNFRIAINQTLILFIESMTVWENALRKIDNKCRIYRLDDFDKNILKIILTSDFHKCPYSKVNHWDDTVYLRLQKVKDDRCDIYQKCIKCGKGDYLLDTYDLIKFMDD